MVSKQKILIVDDDNNIAELISLYFTKECFEKDIFKNSYIAYDCVKTVGDIAIISKCLG